MVVSAIPILATSSSSSGRVARRTGWTGSAVREESATRRITTNPFAIFLPASETPRVWPILSCFPLTTGVTIVWQVGWIQLDSVVVTLCYTLLGDALDDAFYIELGESRYYVCGYLAASDYRKVWGSVCPCGRALEIGTFLHCCRYCYLVVGALAVVSTRTVRL